MQKETFLERIKGTSLEKYTEDFELQFEETVRLHLSVLWPADVSTSQSRIGGVPALPEDIHWPVTDQGVPLSFLAQLNLSEIPRTEATRQLPASGILYFFYEVLQSVWGYDPKDRDKFRVIYSPATSDLHFHRYPAGLPETGKFNPCAISFTTETSLPDIYFLESKEEYDDYYQLVTEKEPVYKMFGNPDIIQNPMELQCEMVTNGVYLGTAVDYSDERLPAFQAEEDNWKLLLQLDSDQSLTNMMWGDGGILYFWIRETDLKACRFDKCWCILQSH